jgi:general secretion pathway protein A
MYLDHYGLREAPFSITPDPRYVFLSERHRDALAHLLYGIGKGGSGGFVQLTGEVGTGKTTLSRLLLEELPENTRVALVLNPMLSPVELVETVCVVLKLDIAGKRGSLKALTDTLNAFLLDAYAEGLRVVLIVDEAQDLSAESLEQVRLLTNLETPTQKLLQIILLGQPELRGMLARPELRQLGQRVTARYHLTPLDAAECEAYVRHRMAVAGCTRIPFTRLGLRALYQQSGGIPRLVNIIADRALMAGFAREEDSIGERLVNRAAEETLPGRTRYRMRRYGPWILAVLVAGALLAAGAWWYAPDEVAPAATVAPVAPQPDAIATSEQSLEAAIAASPESGLHAFTQLRARWQVDADAVSVPAASACPMHVAPGLDCLRGRASLDQLARFDRPLILELHDSRGARASALLQGVGADRILLDVAGGRHELRRDSLSKFWDGDFIAIWALPEGVRGTIKRGDAGVGVAWVMDRLARLDSDTGATIGPAYFDAALEERVRKLQLAYGIQADGIVGPETLFALSALDDAGPHLARVVP